MSVLKNFIMNEILLTNKDTPVNYVYVPVRHTSDKSLLGSIK